MIRSALAGILLLGSGLLPAADHEPPFLIRAFGGWCDIEDAEADDRDLVPKPPRLGEGENGVQALSAAVAALDWAPREKMSVMEVLRGDEEWDPAAAETMLENHREVFARLERFLQFPRLQFETPKTFWDDPVGLMETLDLALLLRLRSHSLAKAGRWPEAVEAIKAQNDFGRLVLSSRGSLVSLLIGLSCDFFTTEEIKHALQDPEFPSGLLPALQPILSSNPDYSGSTRRALQDQFLMVRKTIEVIAQIRPLLDEHEQAGLFLAPGLLAVGGDGWRAWAGQLGVAIGLQPNRTKRLLALGARHSLAKLERPPSEWDRIRPPKLLKFLDRTHPMRFWCSANPVGRMTLITTGGNFDKAILRGHHSLAIRRILLVTWAVRSHHARHGSLPENAAALRPFLRAVPLDPFDEQPIRFSTESKRAWSIGYDLEDKGGTGKREASKFNRNEPTCHFLWLED